MTGPMTETAKLEALKPCKRCEANDYSIMAPGGMWHVECQDCGYITSGACSTQAEAIDRWNRRPSSSLSPPTPTHRHVKRGTEYELIGIGKVQAENWEERTNTGTDEPAPGLSVDMREVAIYRSIDDGSLWARPLEEFKDGRFLALPSPPERGR